MALGLSLLDGMPPGPHDRVAVLHDDVIRSSTANSGLSACYFIWFRKAVRNMNNEIPHTSPSATPNILVRDEECKRMSKSNYNPRRRLP